jgi:hypothetical protein
MKRIKDLVLVIALVSVAGFLLVSCAMTHVSSSRYGVYGENSFPSYFVTDGEVDYSNPFNPMTGTDVTNATVVVSNETTGVSTTLTWVPASGNMQRGSYGGYQQELPHDAGESVSVRIEAGEDVITGGPTVTPNSTVTLTAPGNNMTYYSNIPISVEWTVALGTYPATHCFVTIQAIDGSIGYLTVVPLDQLSYALAPEHFSTLGTYWVTVWPINVMELNGAKEGSVAYVKSTEISYSHQITIISPITP